MEDTEGILIHGWVSLQINKVRDGLPATGLEQLLSQSHSLWASSRVSSLQASGFPCRPVPEKLKLLFLGPPYHVSVLALVLASHMPPDKQSSSVPRLISHNLFSNSTTSLPTRHQQSVAPRPTMQTALQLSVQGAQRCLRTLEECSPKKNISSW